MLSITALVRERLREPVEAGSPTTKGEALALTVVRLARAGDRAMLAPVRRRTGVDPLTSDLTDAELAGLLAAGMGLAADEGR